MRIRRLTPPVEVPTHLLEVTEGELFALRRATEAYVQDEHGMRADFHKPNLRNVLKALNGELAGRF